MVFPPLNPTPRLSWSQATTGIPLDITHLLNTPSNSSPPVSQPGSSFSLPSTSTPSFSVELDSQLYQQMEAQLQQKATCISTMCKEMIGSCVICWAITGKWGTPKDSNHKFFLSCQKISYSPDAYGWIGIKRSCKFQKYEYCFFCGLPQGRWAPSSHPEIRTGTKQTSCPFEDTVAVLAWYIFRNTPSFQAAQRALPTLSRVENEADFKIWVGKVEGRGNFYNALELLIWFYSSRKN